MGRAMTQPERQAWALAYAMRARPTPQLATEALRSSATSLKFAESDGEN